MYTGIETQEESMTLDSAIDCYCGSEDRDFFNFKSATQAVGRQVARVASWEDAKHLMKTQSIRVIVFNLNLPDDKTHQLVEELRKSRPEIKCLAIGRGFREVVEDNFYCIARGVDGTITVAQFTEAVRKLETQRALGVGHIGFGLLCLACILGFTFVIKSPFGKFMSVFWFTILVVELGYCVIVSARQSAFRRAHYGGKAI